jgi:hypothetical protein
VADLIGAAMRQHAAPLSLCYLYKGEQHQLKLEGATADPAESVRLSLRQEPHDYVRNYRDLILARFEDENRTNQKKSNFELLLGTRGELRGVPVQIRYQPNWWFDVILNLKTSETVAEKQE